MASQSNSLSRKLHMGARAALCLSVCLLLASFHPPQVTAQSAMATLSGVVSDEAGALVTNVRLTVLNLSTALERHALTNEEGRYVIPFLPPGRYHVTAEREGFSTVEIRDVVLNVNDELSLRIKLKVGELGETVTIVEGGSNSVQEAAAVSTMVTRQFIENLPLNGRSFQSLMELSPGAVLTRTRFDEQGQFSVNGQRANANYFMVDGVSANIAVSAGATPGQAAGGSLPALTTLGGTNNLVSIDALQEFRIQTSTYAPEFGRTPGAQVSMVTRSGTNEFHGSVFNYFRNDALDANDFFANSRGLRQGRLRQNDFGGVLGGPVIRDRGFFFVSYEGLRLSQPQVAVTEVPTIAARTQAPAPLRPFLNAFPLPNGAQLGNGFAEFVAGYSDPSRLDALSLRLDTTLRRTTSLFARFNRAPSETVQRGGVTLTGFTGQSLNTRNRTSLDTTTMTLGATTALSPRVTNDLRANWSDVRGATTLMLDDFGGAVPLPVASLFPALTEQAEAGFQFLLRGGANSNFGVGRIVDNRQRQLNVVEHLSVLRGSQQLKFGLDYRMLLPLYHPLRYQQTVVFGDDRTTGVQFIFGNAGRAYQVQVSAEDEPRVARFTNLSAYAQSTWRMLPRLSFTYGVRWEFNPPPVETHGRTPLAITRLDDPTQITFAPRGTPLWESSYLNFAPRFGMAYLLWPKQGTTWRGGIGLFYDLGTGQAGQAFGSAFPFRKEKLLENVAFPLTPEQAAPPRLSLDPPYGTVYAFDPQLKLPYTLQWSTSLEQPLGDTQRLSATYVGAIGRRLTRGATLLNPTPNFTALRVVVNAASSDYHALQLNFTRRLARGLQTQASYVWAHAIDFDSDDSASNLFRNLKAAEERADANYDVRHAFHAAVTYNLPHALAAGRGLRRALLRDWALDALVRARTATPVNVFHRTGQVVAELVEAQRPDLVPGVPLYLRDAGAPGGRRLNRQAFAIVSGRQGTLGRNALRGFGFSQIDLALRRQLTLGERFRLQLRVEVFNLLNRPNFGDPVGDLSSRFFGQSTQMLARSLGSGGVNGGLSPLYQIGGARSLQLAFKLQF